jgi:hypothetical protein
MKLNDLHTVKRILFEQKKDLAKRVHPLKLEIGNWKFVI